MTRFDSRFTIGTDAALRAQVVASNATNVMFRTSSLANAVGDGDSHPLSERFATLSAAQEVFPAATSLDDEIDRHAINLALVESKHVVVPGRTYVLDAPLLTDPAGDQTIYFDGAT
ncbi:MAG TPA: hypothetical protein VIG24_05935, partial [Acidimicrobiia bacterium]